MVELINKYVGVLTLRHYHDRELFARDPTPLFRRVLRFCYCTIPCLFTVGKITLLWLELEYEDRCCPRSQDPEVGLHPIVAMPAYCILLALLVLLSMTT